LNKEEYIISLSHLINEDTPVYGNKGGFIRKKLSSIRNGDSANSEYWEFNNHLGTHIDFPKHFCDDGKSSSDYATSFFWTNKVTIVEMEKTATPGQIIGVSDICNLIPSIDSCTEFFLLKTGFEQFRNQEIYWSQNPGYHPDLFIYLRSVFPALKFFGFDTISLTSILSRDLGRIAHKQFLCNENPLLVIEDMHLKDVNKDTRAIEIIIAHSNIAFADGSPVNCILKYKNC
jgi:arylformamidase